MHSEPKRVLILSASAGTGHLRAADALEKVFRQDPRVGEVLNLDALEYTNKLFRDFYSKLYTTLVKSAPEFLGWWYDKSDEPWRTDAARGMLDRLNTGPLLKQIRKFDPHITVCTHFMPAGIISHLIAKGDMEAQLSIVVTDFDFHAMWLSRAFHRYFVAIDETRVHLELLGLPAERITVSGIPIDPRFSDETDRRELRSSLQLDADKPLLLVSGGALGVGPAAAVVRRLQHLKTAVHCVVVCGKSDELRTEVEKIANPEQFTVLGYTDRMHDYMKAADLYIGKPGGLTTSEALACGLPMVIISPIPGQEERNSDHLLEEGIAIKANDLITLPYKIDRLIECPDRLAAMSQRARAFGRPRAAWVVAETLLSDNLLPLTISEDQQDAIAEAAAEG